MSKYRLADDWLPPQSENSRKIFRRILNPLELPLTENGLPPEELTISGSYGNGKSMLIGAALHVTCMRNPGLQVLVVRNELATLNGILLPQLSSKVLK